MDSLVHMRALTGGRAGVFSGRVGSIICRERAALVLDRDRIPDDMEIPQAFAGRSDQIRTVVARAAPSVGKIEYKNNRNEWQVMATCFRVGSDPCRIATARHVAEVLLQAGAWIDPGPDPVIQPARLRNLRPGFRVVFEKAIRPDAPDPSATDAELPEEERAIAAIELSHGEIDLMLLRLDVPSERAPLEPGDPLDLAHDPAICVLGYPVTEEDSPHFAELFSIGGKPVTGIKRASPGIAESGPSDTDVLHDATTLQGSSGSPVLSLTDGRLVGLHYSGISGMDQNRLIHLPVALELDALRDRFDPQAREPPRAFPQWPRTDANRVRGKTLREGWTAEEHRVAAPLAARGEVAGLSQAVPDGVEWSPAVLSDRRDIRDRYYAASLRDPLPTVLPPRDTLAPVVEQGILADCTGCALGIAIEMALLRQKRRDKGGKPIRVSRRMLYEMARLHDEFIDDQPGGSSLRGAIKAFFHNGVCPASDDDARPLWNLSVSRAKEAREIALGAYFRLRPSLPDFQMAIQEAGAVVISAHTHAGWTCPAEGRIRPSADRRAAHAFVLVGYDRDGFLIQNSWGRNWSRFAGLEGVAHWRYDDWAENGIDAWVLQTAPCAPGAHNLPLRTYRVENDPAPDDLAPELAALPDPRRMAILGHVAHAERMGLVDAGRIGVGPRTIRETALFLAQADTWRRPVRPARSARHDGKGDDAETGYDGIAFLFHDPILGAEAMARLTAHFVPRFKARGIYPISILYGADEIRSIVARMEDEARTMARRAGMQEQDLTGWLDRRARLVCRPMLDAFLDGLDAAAAPGGSVWQVLATLGHESFRPPDDLKGKQLRHVHVVAFGMGALVAEAGLRDRKAVGMVDGANRMVPLTSVSLVAPITRNALPLTSKGKIPLEPRIFEACLGPARPRGHALPGYSGDWCDLVATMMPGHGLRPRTPDGAFDRVQTLAGLVADPAVLEAMLKTLADNSRDHPSDRPARA